MLILEEHSAGAGRSPSLPVLFPRLAGWLAARDAIDAWGAYGKAEGGAHDREWGEGRCGVWGRKEGRKGGRKGKRGRLLGKILQSVPTYGKRKERVLRCGWKRKARRIEGHLPSAMGECSAMRII